jgi:hypothetical protein
MRKFLFFHDKSSELKLFIFRIIKRLVMVQ